MDRRAEPVSSVDWADLDRLCRPLAARGSSSDSDDRPDEDVLEERGGVDGILRCRELRPVFFEFGVDGYRSSAPPWKPNSFFSCVMGANLPKSS